MQLDEMPHDGETQADTRLTRTSCRLPESLEDVRQELGLDARSGVAHFHAEAMLYGVQHDRHVPARRREFNRVREEVPDDLFQTTGIALHQQRPIARNTCGKDNAFVVGAESNGLDAT